MKKNKKMLAFIEENIPYEEFIEIERQINKSNTMISLINEIQFMLNIIIKFYPKKKINEEYN